MVRKNQVRTKVTIGLAQGTGSKHTRCLFLVCCFGLFLILSGIGELKGVVMRASVGAMGMVWGALGGTGGGGGRLDLSSCPGEPEEYMDSPAWARQPGPRLEIVPPARDSSGFCSQDSGGVGALL